MNIKTLLITFVVFVLGVFALQTAVDAQLVPYCDSPDDPLGLECVQESGLGRDDPRIVITRTINAALGLLGITATVLMLYAGVTWMTAGGNDEKAATARKILFSAVIGLIIILMAYAISNYVLTNLIEATGVEKIGI